MWQLLPPEPMMRTPRPAPHKQPIRRQRQLAAATQDKVIILILHSNSSETSGFFSNSLFDKTLLPYSFLYSSRDGETMYKDHETMTVVSCQRRISVDSPPHKKKSLVRPSGLPPWPSSTLARGRQPSRLPQASCPAPCTLRQPCSTLQAAPCRSQPHQT